MGVQLTSILKTFKQNCFDPLVNRESEIPDEPGNYIICLKSNSSLPQVPIVPKLKKLNGFDVIYTGIASGSLRARDYRQHFKGNNAGRSTLRKSLGVLFGFKLIPRDNNANSNKTKFNDSDEMKLSDWMTKNLLMYYLPNNNFEAIEIELINYFNPPLNLKGNHNAENTEFRKLLSDLRNKKTSVIPVVTVSNKIVKSTKTSPAKQKSTAIRQKPKRKSSKKTSKNTKDKFIDTVLNRIDDELIKTGKSYMSFTSACKLLINESFFKDKTEVKKMLESNAIPHAVQTSGAKKYWRIPLSKKGFDRKNKQSANVKPINVTKSKEVVLKCPYCGSKNLEYDKDYVRKGFNTKAAAATYFITKSPAAGLFMGEFGRGYDEEKDSISCSDCGREIDIEDLFVKDYPKQHYRYSQNLKSSTSEYSSFPGCVIIFLVILFISIIGYQLVELFSMTF